MKWFDEFKQFAMRGNVVDMAVGIIIGGAFSTIVKSLVGDVLMPPLGIVLGGVDFADRFVVLRDGLPPPPYATLAAAQKAGAVTLNYGAFVNAVVAFVILAFAVFVLVKGLNELRRREAAPAPASTKDCPRCFTAIPAPATRCPNCTSELDAS